MMRRRTIFVSLSEFCENDNAPRKVLVEAGFEVRENDSGRRILREEMYEALQGVDAVIAGVEPYEAALLNALPSLRCISRCGVGLEAIDLDAAQRLNISVRTTAEEVIEPVAQMTLAMIFALSRNFPIYFEDFRNGFWQKHSGYLISEWTIGLVGFGRIGRVVERYLRVFKPRLLIADPDVNIAELEEDIEIRRLPSVLSESDLISIHASRSPEKGPIIGRDEIAMMKKGSRIVNTARGYLVDDAALYEALTSGHIAAAALDVFGTEPYSGPLAHHARVLCTPHVSSLTVASRKAMELHCAENVVKFFQQNDNVNKNGSIR